MKIIDTFLFSEPHEDDLLYVKFQLENDGVDYWIIQENSYTLQGDKKENCAKEVLEQERFKPFHNKIIVVSADELIKPGEKSESVNFERENWQRTIAGQIIFSHFNHDDVRVIVSDTDESLDFSDEERKYKLFNIIRNTLGAVKIGRMRYWYDYDNRCYLPNISIPVLHINEIRHNPGILGMIRHWNCTTFEAGEEPLAFEYSYVFRNMEDVWRKKCTYAHTNFTEDSIKVALECNHWPRPIERGEELGGSNKYDFFEKVELNEKNSPRYVRENLQTLKTNIVNPDYKNLRKEKYNI